MNKIEDLLDKYIERRRAEMPKLLKERREYVQEFTDKINTERVGTKWKPLKLQAVAVMVGHLKNQDLHFFLKKCNEYQKEKGSFSKCFFGALKKK